MLNSYWWIKFIWLVELSEKYTSIWCFCSWIFIADQRQHPKKWLWKINISLTKWRFLVRKIPLFLKEWSVCQFIKFFWGDARKCNFYHILALAFIFKQTINATWNIFPIWSFKGGDDKPKAPPGLGVLLQWQRQYHMKPNSTLQQRLQIAGFLSTHQPFFLAMSFRALFFCRFLTYLLNASNLFPGDFDHQHKEVTKAGHLDLFIWL